LLEGLLDLLMLPAHQVDRKATEDQK
jgi:hypothetical protein